MLSRSVYTYKKHIMLQKSQFYCQIRNTSCYKLLSLFMLEARYIAKVCLCSQFRNTSCCQRLSILRSQEHIMLKRTISTFKSETHKLLSLLIYQRHDLLQMSVSAHKSDICSQGLSILTSQEHIMLKRTISTLKSKTYSVANCCLYSHVRSPTYFKSLSLFTSQ